MSGYVNIMKDEKTKQKEKQLIEMVKSFYENHLNEEYKRLSINLIKKMGRKHNVPFKRGKLKNWASGVIYAIAQINFLFDKSQELYTSPDEICDFFGTKKSTASNKARDIREMFNISHFNEEFSSKAILDNVPKFYIDANGFIIPEEMVDSNSMDDFFDTVYSLYMGGEVDKAMDMLDSIPKDSSEYGRALFYKSIIVSSTGDEDEGFGLFQEALFSEVKNNLDTYGFSLDDFDLDVVGGDDIHIFDLDDIDDLFYEAKSNYDNGDFEEANSYFEEILKLKPDHINALYYNAISLSYLDEFDEALKLIDKAIELNPKDDRFWLDKANFLLKLGRMNESHDCFDKAIELNPNNYVIWSNKGFAHLEIEEHEEALKCYNKAIELSPGNIYPIIGKANVYADMGDIDNAQKYYDLAHEIDEKDLELLSNYAHFLFYQKKYDETIKIWDKCLEIEDSVNFWIFKALAYLGLDDDKMADECINAAAEIDPMAIVMLSDMLDD